LLFIAVPLAIGLFWHPAWLLLLVIIAAYVIRDCALALRYRRDLGAKGFELQVSDIVQFALFNWCVPFIDAARIAKGYIVSYGTVLPWSARPGSHNAQWSWRLVHSVRRALGLVRNDTATD